VLVALFDGVHCGQSMLIGHDADCGGCSGALEVLEKIQHPEGKIACQLRLIAVQLYKASKVIAPNVGPSAYD